MNLVEIRLVGLPLKIHQSALQHSDEVMREFSHLLEGEAASHAPGRLIVLDRILQERYRSFTEGANAELDSAIEQGQDTCDITIQIPDDAGPAAIEMAELWDEVDRYCEAGEYLLALRSEPAVAAYRRWILEEFAHQASGSPPRSWSQWHAGAAGT